MLNRTNPLFLIKNSLLLILTVLTLTGCDFSNEQREQQKQELKRNMHQLVLRKDQLIKQKTELQKQLKKTVLDYEYTLNGKNATAAERIDAQEQLSNQVHAIEIQEIKLQKRLLETELKIRKLELEYAKLTRRSKFGS